MQLSFDCNVPEGLAASVATRLKRELRPLRTARRGLWAVVAALNYLHSQGARTASACEVAEVLIAMNTLAEVSSNPTSAFTSIGEVMGQNGLRLPIAHNSRTRGKVRLIPPDGIDNKWLVSVQLAYEDEPTPPAAACESKEVALV
jgi:hypothetical protein